MQFDDRSGVPYVTALATMHRFDLRFASCNSLGAFSCVAAWVACRRTRAICSVTSTPTSKAANSPASNSYENARRRPPSSLYFVRCVVFHSLSSVRWRCGSLRRPISTLAVLRHVKTLFHRTRVDNSLTQITIFDWLVD